MQKQGNWRGMPAILGVNSGRDFFGGPETLEKPGQKIRRKIRHKNSPRNSLANPKIRKTKKKIHPKSALQNLRFKKLAFLQRKRALFGTKMGILRNFGTKEGQLRHNGAFLLLVWMPQKRVVYWHLNHKQGFQLAMSRNPIRHLSRILRLARKSLENCQILLAIPHCILSSLASLQSWGIANLVRPFTLTQYAA